MAKKPSERRNFSEADMELDLTPMMNLIAILIPVLLVSTSFVEISVLNVSAPSIGGSASASAPKDKPDKPPLNLTLTITDKGYTLAGSGAVLPSSGAGKGPTIPIIQTEVSCLEYEGDWPPPRVKNQASPQCKKGDGKRMFWVYDHRALVQRVMEIKDAFPDESRIVIAAEEEVEFEPIIKAMDATREYKDEGGQVRELFSEVVLSPGLT